ncbi:hypothetical protein ES332_D11G307000v1 [Gossypium tomentosum]|uniref:Uncharacterized protein n=1 Tax=Gossypium tomentosum TaxID=34277 RepID=A0A5D2IUD4_GOSTO|nr:hypothetical protein ES332_D11G307000v1 [Gossypium tomentosum]
MIPTLKPEIPKFPHFPHFQINFQLSLTPNPKPFQFAPSEKSTITSAVVFVRADHLLRKHQKLEHLRHRWTTTAVVIAVCSDIWKI